LWLNSFHVHLQWGQNQCQHCHCNCYLCNTQTTHTDTTSTNIHSHIMPHEEGKNLIWRELCQEATGILMDCNHIYISWTLKTAAYICACHFLPYWNTRILCSKFWFMYIIHEKGMSTLKKQSVWCYICWNFMEHTTATYATNGSSVH
jgi:hypothetical protein